MPWPGEHTAPGGQTRSQAHGGRAGQGRAASAPRSARVAAAARRGERERREGRGGARQRRGAAPRLWTLALRPRSGRAALPSPAPRPALGAQGKKGGGEPHPPRPSGGGAARRAGRCRSSVGSSGRVPRPHPLAAVPSRVSPPVASVSRAGARRGGVPLRVFAWKRGEWEPPPALSAVRLSAGAVPAAPGGRGEKRLRRRFSRRRWRPPPPGGVAEEEAPGWG